MALQKGVRAVAAAAWKKRQLVRRRIAKAKQPERAKRAEGYSSHTFARGGRLPSIAGVSLTRSVVKGERGRPKDFFEALRPIARKLVDQGRWPGVAACVFVDGKLRFLEERGFADIEAGEPMTSKSIVRLFSMTKCLVAVAVLQMVDEGHLHLDDQLSKHLPGFENMCVLPEDKKGFPVEGRTKPACRPITIRHLMTHTSGISAHYARDIDGPKRRCSREMAWSNVYADLVAKVDNGEVSDLATWVDELSKIPLFSHPGQFYGYGYGYDVLGRLVEVKSSMSLAAYMKKHIFDPLGMRDTRWDLAGSARKPSVLYRYTKSASFGSDGRRFRLVRLDPKVPGGSSQWARRCTLPSGGGAVSSFAGGLLSTLEDYAKFVLGVLQGGVAPTTGKRFLSAKMAREMLVDQIANLVPRASPNACPYDDPRLGLCGLGEVLRKGAPNDGKWFDGVEGVLQWGGAASTALKYDPNGGRPIVVLLMTQAFPQDDGVTTTRLLQAARRAVREETATEKVRQ